MATDFLAFTEGENYLLGAHGGATGGLPATCYFALSTNAVANFTTASTLAGGIAEITGTGYARQSQAAPAPASGSASFSAMNWSTASATNWPAAVKSVVLVSTSDNTGKAICAWNLIPGGGSRDLSQANTTEQVTPTLTTSS
jgi:hypothetical protein